MKPTDTDALVRAFLARGGKITRVEPGRRPDPKKLARTGAERFFASQHLRGLSTRERDEYMRGLAAVLGRR